MANNLAGNVAAQERNIYSDYAEISPWNSSYMKHYKQVQKPSWKYVMGTMPDLQHLIRNSTVLLVITGFFRTLGMWMGISNPVLGVFVLIAFFLDTWYNAVYVMWSVVWMMIWSWVMSVPKELIYNGLYPVQGILLGEVVYFTSSAEDQLENLLPQLLILIFLLLLTLILFQALCSFFVKVLNVSPMMIAPYVVGVLYKGLKHKSTFLKLVEAAAPIVPDTENLHFFNESFNAAALEVVKGVSTMAFSLNYGSAIALTIGTAVASPIMAVMAWLGSLVGTLTCVALSPTWSEVTDKYFLFNSVISMTCIAGTFFVLTPFSLFMGVVTTIFTVLATMALNAFFEPLPLMFIGPLGMFIVVIAMYTTAGSFPNMIPVELVSMTTPEDHLRRYILSRRILKDLKIKEAMTYKRLSPADFRQIEQCLLPIIMCSYAKNGFLQNLKTLLDLGADPNASDYDGRCALHIAAAENKKEVVYLLLNYQADINREDCFQNNPLSAALRGQHYDLALYIYKKGGRISLSSHTIASLLCYAVFNGDVNQLKMWLKCGADVHAKDYDDRTALHIAYANSSTDMIKVLEEYTADGQVDKDRWGHQPAECDGVTVMENKCTTLDIDDGEELTRSDSFPEKRRTAQPKLNIDPAILFAVIESILQNDDELKKMALLPSLLCEIVYVKDHVLLSELIAQYSSASIEKVSDYDLRTPLHIAAVVGNIEAVKLLIWNKANVNAVDRFGTTPLLEACRNKHSKVAAYLKRNGAMLASGNAKDDQLLTTELCWAVYNNDFDMISRLVENGAPMTLADYDGRNCVDLARDLQNTNMMDHMQHLLQSKESVLAPL